jgi:hypothetical protein
MSVTRVFDSSRMLALALLAALFLVIAGHARAEAPAVKPVGPWVVTDAKDTANVGLIFYFSPDGTFGLVDPKTMIGAAGTYSVGRAGLMINVFNVGQSAEFMSGDLAINGDTMVIDVKKSAIMEPQRVTLRSVKIIPPQPARLAPAAR